VGAFQSRVPAVKLFFYVTDFVGIIGDQVCDGLWLVYAFAIRSQNIDQVFWLFDSSGDHGILHFDVFPPLLIAQSSLLPWRGHLIALVAFGREFPV
jgi:hypothetical protein